MKQISNRRKILLLITCIFFICLVFILYYTQVANKKIRIGTGKPGGTYYSYIQEFSEISEDDMVFKSTETAGTVASIRLLHKGFIDAAIVQNDLLYSAINGTDYFENENTRDNLNFSAVAGLYTESFQIVTADKSNIESIEDLKGKRVSVGEEQSGVILNVSQILTIHGMSFDDFECSYLSFSESSRALANGEIDAFFCMAGAPTAAISECADSTDIRIISLTQSDIDKITNLYPYYVTCTIPAGTYNGITEDVTTVGVRAVFVVSTRLSDKKVRAITENLIKYSDSLNDNIVTDEILSAGDAAKGISIPFHPGAASYYSDNGITVPVASGSSGSNLKVIFAGQDR